MRLRDRAHPVLTPDGGAILDEATGQWTQLTPTAATATALLLATDSTDRAAEQYAARYSISPGQAARDIQVVADMLTALGLTRSEKPMPRRRWWLR